MSLWLLVISMKSERFSTLSIPPIFLAKIQSEGRRVELNSRKVKMTNEGKQDYTENGGKAL